MMQREPDLIGKGWPFPLRVSADGRLTLIGGEEKIRQSIHIILDTAPGERQMLPEFGCGIHDLPYEANTHTFRVRVERKVQEALVRWEPRIDVLSVAAESSAEVGNLLVVHIAYRIRANNALFNLVYPFFVNEGPR